MRLPATIGLVFVMILLWITGFIFTPKDEPAGILAVSVGGAILEHIRPWVFFTAGFYHPHFVQLVLMLPLTFGLAKRVEPDLGALNVVRLLVFVNAVSSLVLFVDMFCLYIIFREPIYLKTGLSGFYGGLTALLVAYMKSNPHATTSIAQGLQLRLYPLAVSTICLLCTIGATMSTSVVVRSIFLGAGPYAFMGSFFGWYYLRFLIKNRDQTKGNVSDDFALVMLGPDTLAPMIGSFANFCFNVAKLCGYFKNRSTPTATSLPIVIETTDDPIAERRKARALKALDEKLAKIASAQTSTVIPSTNCSMDS